MNSSVERQSKIFGVNFCMQPDTWVQEKNPLLELGCSVLGLSLCSHTGSCGSPWVTLLCPWGALTITLNLFVIIHCAEFFIYHQELATIPDFTLRLKACEAPLWPDSFLWVSQPSVTLGLSLKLWREIKKEGYLKL